MNLEQLRKQAKDLVRAARGGEQAALDRLGDLPVRLASAQLVLARENGYASWPELVRALEAGIERFVVLATSNRRDRAEAALAARPELERDRWVRLLLGRGWDGDPNEPGGPRGWSPLHYACHSCFETAATARDLLERGANPNAYFANEYGPMSTLYGAAGVLHDPELTLLLLRHGADPNGEPHFGDALYHSVEAADTACLELLLDHGARPQGSNALAHALDYDRLEHVRLLLEGGADPNERAALVHAVRRGRGPRFVRLLVEHGADVDRRGGEFSTPPDEHRTAYQNAVLRARQDVTTALAKLGASTDVSGVDLAVAAIARGERPQAPLPERLDPDALEVLAHAAGGDHLDLVVELFGADLVVRMGGGPPGGLIHYASWGGMPEVVRRLLELDADPVASSGANFDTPIAWAFLGSRGHRRSGSDYVAVVESLIGAGALLEDRFAEVVEGPLAAWLDRHVEP